MLTAIIETAISTPREPVTTPSPTLTIPPDRDIGRIMREVAEREILPRFRNLATHEVQSKSHPNDLVTAADIAAERVLTEALPALLPDSRVIGEEAADANPGVLEWLAGAAPVWLVDPVDGTVNFANGRESFAIIIALCVAGTTVAGWIYDPVNENLVRARRGEGAFFEDKGGAEQRLQITAGSDLAAMRGSMTHRAAKVLRTNAARLSFSFPRHIGRLGCTGLEYANLARGSLDFALYTRLKPWDHAAGVLIHKEAGGCGGIRPGALPYRPGPVIAEETLLLAPSEATWRLLDSLLG
ncbi:MAG: inositol monophosphatase [Rhodospirillales bacterium]|nr:inositol monophosphatase [Rhodospirillales bacterium]